MKDRLCIFNEAQLEALGERVEEVLESTYDWDSSSVSEHNSWIGFWTDIVRELGFNEKADELDKEYLLPEEEER